MVTGYLHAQYSQSLTEFGTPRFLPESGGWILERPAPNSPYLDAMGCYPLFACRDWSRLQTDLENIGTGLISLSVVTDPFGEYDLTLLRDCFADLVIPFKQHFVVDLARKMKRFVRPHHLRNARRAQSTLLVEICASPPDFLNEWTTLYETLVTRHGITGIAAFSKESFAKQLAVPGVVALRAMNRETTEGMLLWYVQGDVAYYHLGAYSARGYDLRASFALFSYALEYFAQKGLRWLNLGGASGSEEGQSSGLSRFKEGWSTGTRTAYLCGRIFDQQRYAEATRTSQVAASDYFPAYRKGEFG
ncbi:MAG TPA: GNAT family N-acetyltransferase [Pyrinomonadaceae bacterium]|nr:GNAT family N-acetyltransferase [Pyrinomonadaceae bacterium]